jgi:hypothetical protein
MRRARGLRMQRSQSLDLLAQPRAAMIDVAFSS